jgi:hypothetical protein
LEQLRKIWDAFINFLATYDSSKITELLRNLKWQEVVANPYVWLIGLPTLGYLLVRKRFKTLISLFSLAGFLYLLQYTFPSSGENIPLDKLLTFIGGSVLLAVVNLYFLFMRGD